MLRFILVGVALATPSPPPPPPKGVQVSPSPRGPRAPGPDTIAYPIVRMTLDIPETGTSAWRREDLNGADPTR